MKAVTILAAVVLTACAANKTPPVPKYNVAQPHITRISAFTDDILYSYRIDARGDGFLKAAADADQWCNQHGLLVTVRAEPACKEFGYADGVQVFHCNVAFKCQ